MKNDALRRIQFAPSMMCADISRVTETLDIFARGGVEWLHIDVMDGAFVPNMQIGVDYVRQLRGLSDIPLDIHLMTYEPGDKVAWFDPRPGEYVSIHYEATPHPQRVLADIRSRGARPMLALNPATPLDSVEYLMDDIDAVLIMTVNPGYAGQKLIPSTIGKIAELRARLDDRGRTDIAIEVDGNVNALNARDMIAAGADILVLGSSAIFGGGADVGKALTDFRAEITGRG
ncbi:MAG: ribulose-phosphate 3-epimerase [Clostridiales Family XIII bacterium]|jgi:ribulose-phosphate 3-epimerase|nr:ribulose-phosphate 3-epimerase [Clostridiales Family XIII bacterium]